MGHKSIQKNPEGHEATRETYQIVLQPAIKDLCCSLKSSPRVKIVQSSSSSWPFDLPEFLTQGFWGHWISFKFLTQRSCHEIKVLPKLHFVL